MTVVHMYDADYSDKGNRILSSRELEPGAIRLPVADLREFTMNLRWLRDEGMLVDRLIIDTHGSPGAIYFGKEWLDHTRLQRFRAGFSRIFAAGARIFLSGCNVAESCGIGKCSAPGDGRRFLMDFARCFLSRNGGCVGASTSLGFANLFTNRVYHFWGDTVYALINRGGAKLRIGVGPGVKSPIGSWKVTANGRVFYYSFDRRQVYWEDELPGKDSGKGTWKFKNDVLRIKWESGSVEKWDLPLFHGEQSGTWRTWEGKTCEIVARKGMFQTTRPLFSPTDKL